MTQERCATCKHWGSENRKDAALCMSPMLGRSRPTIGQPDKRATESIVFESKLYGRQMAVLPAGLSVHREMMSATDGKDCAGFEAV